MAARLGTSILVVEDEPAIQELLRLSLGDAGFDVHAVADAEGAHAEIRRALPDLVLLDWMLPGQSGLALARTLRADARTRELPIIMVTARSEEADRVTGLEAWVDDYVTKPFSPRELKARIKSVLRRRAPEAAQETLAVGPLKLDPVTHRVTVDERPVPMGPTEFKLLRFLMINRERVLSKSQILDHVWQYDFGGSGGVVENYISYLRKKVDHVEPALIHTVRGFGYVLRREP